MDETENKTLNLIKRKEWLVLIAIVLVCIGIAYWMFFGTLQTTIEVEGCVFMYEGRLYTSAFVSNSYAEKIKTDETSVKVFVDGYNHEEYGYLSGTAAFVSNSPIDKEKACEFYGSDVVKYLTGDNSRTYLTVFDLGSATEPITFSTGNTTDQIRQCSYCELSIIIEEFRPYQLIF